MTSAQAILKTLVDGGVNVCFANPGTSEIHLVAAMEKVPQMRTVLCLFEGVATGAADGYGRMAEKPASTLLHLGPGLSNGIANLHNARRAGTPVVNVVGDHATYHKRFDAPLETDIEAMARTVSKWVRRSIRASDVGVDTAEAISAALQEPGGIATLILPADVSWSEEGEAALVPDLQPAVVDTVAVERAAKLLRDEECCVLFLGGNALRIPGLEAASRVAAVTGARLLAEKSPARHERGAGIPHVDRLAYAVDSAMSQLAGTRHLILAGARSPVAFFAYPGKPGSLVPEGCTVHELGGSTAELELLADLVASGTVPKRTHAASFGMPSGSLTAQKAAAIIGALIPEGAIIAEEANTCDRWLPEFTVGSAPHDWLNITGGAIGMGMPVATGAAIACPDRPVINLEADGSALYTLQALWTQSREGLDVTTVIFNNASYAILGIEMRRMTSSGNDARKGTAHPLFDLTGLDFVALANGMGVPATRAHTAEEFADQLRKAIDEPGPHLIDAIVPPLMSFSG
ncbi:acetolactate synthase large subunit [Streptomyces sp. NPDC050535]|uniref:acetolactate synthase large subunit n=1 Tax=Streptomyces sp. NPDC050535 TaxID=3365626 RepID=UPI0037B11913